MTVVSMMVGLPELSIAIFVLGMIFALLSYITACRALRRIRIRTYGGLDRSHAVTRRRRPTLAKIVTLLRSVLHGRRLEAATADLQKGSSRFKDSGLEQAFTEFTSTT
jgi:hypothetical protein